MNKIQRENELKMRVWNDTIKDSLIQVYGEENVLEVEPFTFCIPELDCEGNETCLKIKLSTPRKNADGEEYDMYEEAKAYEATEWVNFDNKYMRHDIGKAIDEA